MVVSGWVDKSPWLRALRFTALTVTVRRRTRICARPKNGAELLSRRLALINFLLYGQSQLSVIMALSHAATFGHYRNGGGDCRPACIHCRVLCARYGIVVGNRDNDRISVEGWKTRSSIGSISREGHNRILGAIVVRNGDPQGVTPRLRWLFC